MQHLKELPPGTVWQHLIDGIKSDSEHAVIEYAQSRMTDVDRGAETAELAALLVEKFAMGISKTLQIVGIDNNVMAIADSVVREIDPEFEKNRAARWAARPAAIATNSSTK